MRAPHRTFLLVAVLGACQGPPAARTDAASPDATDATPPGDAAPIGADATPSPVDAASPEDATPASDAPPAADAGPCAGQPEGADCDDGDACTQVDVCQAGACVGTTPIVCEARGECFAPGVCEPATGRCTTVPLPDDSACNDGSICTQTDRCVAGECVGGDPIEHPGTRCEHGICFTDVSESAGIGISTDPLLTQQIGAGGAFLDADGDGWLDVLIGGEGYPPRLFLNDGDGTFTDVTDAAGLPAFTVTDDFMGFAAADYDNDGDVDLYLLREGANMLLANDGSGVFTDVTSFAGVGDERWGTAAAFGDFDRDGDLDLYVGNYIQELAFPAHLPDANVLYRNLGDGTFEDVTDALGVGGAGTTLSVAWSDWDADGDVDLHVCNDFGQFIEPNRLYDVDAASFADVAPDLDADLAFFCMNIAPGDYDRDGDLDYYYSNLGRNALLANEASGFVDRTDATGTDLHHDDCFTEQLLVSWGAAFHDFDQDGWLDLYVSNGYIPAAPIIANPKQQIDSLLRHDGETLTFTDISRTAGVDDVRAGRGAAFGDYDQDGDVDVLQLNLDSVALLRNDSPSPGGAITVDVRGRLSNRDGIGARLALALADFTAVREINPNTAYLSRSQRAAHFGLGDATEAVSLSIRWPSGIDQLLVYLAAGARLLAVEPWVTIDSAAADASPVAEGATASVDVTLRNHASAPVTVTHSLALRVPGQSPILGAATSTSVPASSTASATLSLEIPPGATGGSATSAELVVTATDDDGGTDQRIAPLDLTP